MRWRRALAAVVVAIVVAGCSSGGSPDRGVSDGSPPSTVDRPDEMAQPDAAWDDSVAHRDRMATGDLTDRSAESCDDADGTADCPLSLSVDGWSCVVAEPVDDRSLIGEQIATLDDGSAAHVLDGAEPAIYLVRVSSDGPELLVAAACSTFRSGSTSPRH